MTIDRTAFRDAMARMGAAVNVVTSAGPAGRCGYTCTAVCSVTDDPAMVLVCLNRGSAMNPIFRQNGVFCVNVLSGSQQYLSRQFAGHAGVAMEDRFADLDWIVMTSGAPALRHAVSVVDCQINEVKEVGTHSILFGKVIDVRVNGGDNTLVYCNRNYHAVPHSIATAL